MNRPHAARRAPRPEIRPDIKGRTLQSKPQPDFRSFHDAGTISQLLTARPNDKSDAGFKDWRFMTVHFWGEDPVGDWKLHVIDRVSSLLVVMSQRL